MRHSSGFAIPLLIFAVLTGSIAALTLVDFLREPGPVVLGELLIDLADRFVLISTMALVAWTVYRLRDLGEDQQALQNNLSRMAAQGEVWRHERRQEIAALGTAIEDQFHRWQLSPAEIDIAGLMLKGATLKEIALARDTSEATIRQQAQAIYRKSGLSGRAELSAYFLESLFETAEDIGARRRELSLVTNPT
jgi:DNA-binding CsgD family transcriptional regulator